jgi:hypothetical protein
LKYPVFSEYFVVVGFFTVFDTCTPRPDVLNRTIAEADFAADLAKVIRGDGSPESTSMRPAFLPKLTQPEGYRTCSVMSWAGLGLAAK